MSPEDAAAPTTRRPAEDARRPAEELPVGEEVGCGSHEVTLAEIVDFATRWDPQYFHVDPDAAAHSEFGGIIASGVHTTAILQRLLVDGLYSRYDVVAGRVIRELRFLRPVFPGDVLRGSAVVRSVQPGRPGRAEVVVEGTLRNQRDAAVLELEVHTVVRTRAAARPRAGM